MKILHTASLWSLREYPNEKVPWTVERQLDSIAEHGFGAVTGRINVEIGRQAQQRNLRVIGFISSSDLSEFDDLLKEQQQAGAEQINVQLADEDTSGEEALGLLLQLREKADRYQLHISIEIHRDTCTETPEKTFALADAFQRIGGEPLPLTWDFSHLAVVKHLAPPTFSKRLLGRKDLIRIANQFHLRPFNGHHAQIPVTDGNGELTRELLDWIPFVKDLFWLLKKEGKRDELVVVPEMGPVNSGYHLSGWPLPWEETIVLKTILQKCWEGLEGKDGA